MRAIPVAYSFSFLTLLAAACNIPTETTSDSDADLSPPDGGAKPTGSTSDDDASEITVPEADAAESDASFRVDLESSLDGGGPNDSGVSPADGGTDASISCTYGRALCDGKCVYTDSSVEHCGACGNACGAQSNATSTCSAGKCSYACLPGFKDDGAGCTALPPSTAISIVAGNDFSCILRADGTVGCWGPASFLPYVPGITTATSIAAGGGVACAVLTNGHIECWTGAGTRTYTGQTDGDLAAKNIAKVAVTNGNSKTAAEAVCVGLVNGDVYCWGGVFYYSTPIVRPQFANAVRLTASQGHVAALFADGTHLSNSYGAMPQLTGVTAVGLGGAHTCAVVAGGAVICSGYNQTGECGDGTGLTQVQNVYATGVANAVDVVANYYNTCALIADGTVQCWGRTGGNVGSTIQYAPKVVAGISGAVKIAMGERHTCVLKGDGSVSCWGSLKTGP